MSLNAEKKIEIGKTVMRQMKPMAGRIKTKTLGRNEWGVRWADGRMEWFEPDALRRMLLD